MATGAIPHCLSRATNAICRAVQTVCEKAGSLIWLVAARSSRAPSIVQSGFRCRRLSTLSKYWMDSLKIAYSGKRVLPTVEKTS